MLRFSDGDFASGLEEDKTAEGKDSLIGSLDEETDLLPTGVLDLEVRVTLGEAVEELALKEDDRNTPCLRILLADFSSSVCIDNSFFICCSMCIARRRRVCVGPKIFIAFSISTSCDWELPDEENEEVGGAAVGGVAGVPVYDIYVRDHVTRKGFFKQSQAFRMYPVYEVRNRVDEYGEVVDLSFYSKFEQKVPEDDYVCLLSYLLSAF